jgi:hypothetical protein
VRSEGALIRRSLLLEALFNPRWKQRGGLAWVLDGEARIPSEPFNVNPVLSGYVIGWIRAQGADDFQRNRGSLSAALGGFGDRLVWGLLRPLAVVASLIATVAGPIAAALALVLVYNPAEIYLRRRSLREGLKGRAAVLQDLTRSGLPALAPRMARIFALLLGILAGSWLMGHVVSGRYLEGGAGAVASIAGWLFLRRRTLGFWRLPLAAFALGLAWFAVEVVRMAPPAAGR